MNILAINTAFSQTYVAVKSDLGVFLNEMYSSLKQSENLLGLIDKTLSEANIQIADLNKIACVIGPGSFTGIRIGVGICKGLCFGKNTLRCEANSLDLLAYTFAKNKQDKPFWVILNALSGNLFARKYNADGTPDGQCKLLKGEDLLELQGNVVGLKEEELEMCNHYVSFSAAHLLEYAENLPHTKDFAPLYLRKSQAEAELDKKNGNS